MSGNVHSTVFHYLVQNLNVCHLLYLTPFRRVFLTLGRWHYLTVVLSRQYISISYPDTFETLLLMIENIFFSSVVLFEPRGSKP